MTQNPFYNAILAAGYIVLVVFIMQGLQVFGTVPDNILMPMVALSLFVLSAAVMGYLFFYQPAMLYLEGQQREGVNLFLRTVGLFAMITAAFIATLFAVSFS